MSSETSFQQRMLSIAHHEPSPYYIHESALFRMLELNNGEDFATFLDRVAKGGTGGNRREDGWVDNPEPYNIAIDVQDLSNDNLIHLHSKKYGAKNERGLFETPAPTVANDGAIYYTFGAMADTN